MARTNLWQQWKNRLYEILAFLDREAYQNILPWYALTLITPRKKLWRYHCENAFLICFCQKPFVKLAMCLLPIRLDVAQQCLPFAAVIGGGGGGRGEAGTRMMEKETFRSKVEISQTYPSLGPSFAPIIPRWYWHDNKTLKKPLQIYRWYS